MTTLYRIAQDEDGSRQENSSPKPGRWNSANKKVWYASESIALAMLEVIQSSHSESENESL